MGHGIGQVDGGAVPGQNGDRFAGTENPPNADRAPGQPSSPGIGLEGLGRPKCPPGPIALSSSTRSIETRRTESAGPHFRTARTLRRGHGLSWLLSAPVTHRHHPSGLAAGKTGSAAGLFDSQGVSLVNLGQGFAELRQKSF